MPPPQILHAVDDHIIIKSDLNFAPDAVEGLLILGNALVNTEESAMGNYKEHPKYNVLSIRVTNKEKALLEKMKRHSRKNISMIMREALQLYSSYFEVATNLKS